MATSIVTFRPIGARARATGGYRNPDTNRRKISSSSSWWTPIYGWSSEPDYIASDGDSVGDKADLSAKAENKSAPYTEAKMARSRFAPGCFTEEKAKQLRIMTTDTSSFHDAMYHSAIASRLASDLSNLSDP